MNMENLTDNIREIFFGNNIAVDPMLTLFANLSS